MLGHLCDREEESERESSKSLEMENMKYHKIQLYNKEKEGTVNYIKYRYTL